MLLFKETVKEKQVNVVIQGDFEGEGGYCCYSSRLWRGRRLMLLFKETVKEKEVNVVIIQGDHKVEGV